MKGTLLTCFLLFTTLSWSQRTIKGKVMDVASGKPVPGASVFLSNTKIGTVSDSQGDFQLSGIPSGRYDLIITSVGYETFATTFTDEQLPLEVKAELKVKVRTLENVTVEPSVEEGWDRWGLLFTDYFIGRTPNGNKCKIKNYKAIKFRYFKKSRRVIAYCDEPIIIENKGLGYRISYQLEDFEVDMKQGISSYAGFPFFEDLTVKRANRFMGARDEAYYGSIMHFLRSVYTDSVVENGFDTYRMTRSANLEKERVRKIYRPFSKSDSTLPEDSFQYYQKVMRQDNVIDKYYPGLLTADSLVVKEEGGFKQVFFPDFIYVTYKKERENSMYLSNQFTPRKPRSQSSHLFLVSGQPVFIDANGGHYPAQELFSMGYWGWSEKIGEMLPLDYMPYGFK